MGGLPVFCAGVLEVPGAALEGASVGPGAAEVPGVPSVVFPALGVVFISVVAGTSVVVSLEGVGAGVLGGSSQLSPVSIIQNLLLI